MSLHFEVTHGLRVDDLPSLQNKVRLKGGRLVAYSEVISAMIISAHSYRVKWIAVESERRSGGLLSNLVTGFLGWWALFGPYKTIAALIWNLRGGVDVTDALMRAHPGNSSLLGYSETVALDAFQESASRLTRWICFGLIAAFIGAVVWVA